LNCGLRIPASAGTDCFLNRIPSRLPGFDRVYVRIDGDFSYARWIEGLKAGHAFVSNGPMLEMSTTGHGIGDVLRVAASESVHVSGRATSQYPLDRIELIHNGKVIGTSRASGDRLTFDIDQAVPIERTGWLALRVTGPPNGDQSRIPLFAHTGATYVDVTGAPIDARADAEKLLAWIDRLATDLHRRDRVPSRSRSHVESQLSEARKFYENLIKKP
jgi:hypothetical protein